MKLVITEKRGYSMNIDMQDKDGNVWYEAYVRSDGCCDVFRYYNHPKKDNEDDYDQIHMCGIPEFIKILQSIEDFRMANLETAE